MSIAIAPIEEGDWKHVWQLIKPVFERGDTYTFSQTITEAEAKAIWVEAPLKCFVAKDENGTIVGTYYIKPNQHALGAHVCNCGYIVDENCRGKGIASLMCQDSQRVAKECGFRAMQFNFVVSTNTGAVKLWKALGFDIVGTLPGAFKHPTAGYVDAFVMFKTLL